MTGDPLARWASTLPVWGRDLALAVEIVGILAFAACFVSWLLDRREGA